MVLAAWFVGTTNAHGDAATSDPHSRAAFEDWRKSDRQIVSEFAAFERFLEGEGVKDVVPSWQIMRTDADYAARCDLAAFAMPPRAKWAAIVPTLKLVRSRIVPLVGRVEVHSAWRSDELNRCVRGARASRHLSFSALDLIAPEYRDKKAMFTALCRLHSRIGKQTRMGLGAYWDPKRPRANREGRFHIDANGFRSWGFDYTGASSGCRKLD